MGYIRARMRSRPAIAVLVASVLVAGCGGSPRQDEDEPTGSYRLEVADATFPTSQSIAESSTMEVEVRNADSKAAPNVAVTVETDPAKAGAGTVAFGQRVDDDRLSDPERPVWVVDEGPQGGDSAATNTWALGRLEAGADEDVPLEGHRRPARLLHDQVPRLARPQRQGQARDGRADGSFKVKIDDKPVPARVNAKGEVVRGEAPGASK